MSSYLDFNLLIAGAIIFACTVCGQYHGHFISNNIGTNQFMSIANAMDVKPYPEENAKLDLIRNNIEYRFMQRQSFTSSSSGLQNCRCRKCNPELTVGKKYKNKCYFVSVDWRPASIFIKYERSAVLTGVDEAVSFMQIASEFYIREYLRNYKLFKYARFQAYQYETSFSFLTNSTEVLKYLNLTTNLPSLNRISEFCLDVKNNEMIVSQCTGQAKIALTVTDRSFFSHEEYEFDYEKLYDLHLCKFRSDAIGFGEKYCFYDTLPNPKVPCELLAIHNFNVLNTAHYYLTNKTNEAGSSTRFYKILKFTPGLIPNFYYPIKTKPASEDQTCVYLDVYGKRIVFDTCSGRSYRNLCVVKANETEIAQGKTPIKKVDSVSTNGQAKTPVFKPPTIKKTDAVSTYGLQSCYCITCDPDKTVGKIFNKECYFVTTDADVSSDIMKYSNRTGRYSPFILRTMLDTILYSQVINEFNTKFYETEIGVHVDSESNERMFRKKFSQLTCLILHTATNTISKTCQHTLPETIFLKASLSHYRPLAPFQLPKYEPCSFDSQAVKLVGEKKCIKALDYDNTCNLASVYKRNFENVHKYLLHLSNQTHLTFGDTSLHMFKASRLGVNPRKDQYARIKHHKTNNTRLPKCVYLDLMRKEIVHTTTCDFASRNLCIVTEDGKSKREGQAGIATYKVNSDPNSKIRTTDVENKFQNLSSNSGLLNCICDSCDPSTSIGKLYNGTCYFTSIDGRFQFRPITKYRQKVVDDKFSPVLISDITEIRILQQLVSELASELGETMLGIYTNSNINLTLSLIPTPKNIFGQKCQVYDIDRNDVLRECNQNNSILLRADESNAVLYQPYKRISYEECSFEKSALNFTGGFCLNITTDVCTKIQNQTITISTDRENDFIKDYLIYNAQPRANELSLLMHTYKLDPVNMRISDKCLYYDVQGKITFQEHCNLKTTFNICVIQDFSSNISKSFDVTTESDIRSKPAVLITTNPSYNTNVTDSNTTRRDSMVTRESRFYFIVVGFVVFALVFISVACCCWKKVTNTE